MSKANNKSCPHCGKPDAAWTAYAGTADTRPPHFEMVVFWSGKKGLWGGGWYDERLDMMRLWGIGGVRLSVGDLWACLPTPPPSKSRKKGAVK